MLSPIKLDTLEIDKGKPFVLVELSDKKDGETIKIFLTRADMKLDKKKSQHFCQLFLSLITERSYAIIFSENFDWC